VGKYSVEVKPPARKELEPPSEGFKDQWRVRVGDWRVVYIIDDTAKLVSVTRIAHRREVYER
jgi:mRNA-degrading endonuclease RelE of RelBE toxin-antitoxin system